MAQYKTLNNFANEFSSSTSYAVGDLVMYLGELYKCTTAHNGAWNSANFTKTSVATQLANSGGGEEIIAYEGTNLPSGTLADWTLHRAVKDGNILWIVFAGKITNSTESSIVISSLMEITIPSDIAALLYRENGVPCNENPSPSYNSIILNYIGTYKTSYSVYALHSPSANTLRLTKSTSESLGSGDSARIDIRIPIFLDTGTVQQ